MSREMKDSGLEWVAEIPVTWMTGRLKNYFSFGKGLPITKDNLVEEGIPVISYGQIHSKQNTGTGLNDSLFRYVNEEFLNTNPNSLVKIGDFIFADTSEDHDGCGNCVYVDNEQTLFAGYHTIILSGNESTDNRYLAYLFKTDAWRNQIRSKVFGIKVYSVTKKILSETTIICPPPCDQKKIADYLDAQCSELDSVLSRTRASIEEYKKLKQAVITQAVTKGICGKHPMKDSGSVWFGAIPQGWKMNKMKYLFQIKKRIAGEEGHTVLSITQRGIKPKDISKNEGQLAESYSNYQIVHPGDFAMNHMDLLTGWVDISQYDGVTSPDYRVFVLMDTVNNDPHYYLYMMQMCYSNRIFYGMGQGVSGLGRWRLQADKFLNFSVSVPPIDEQKEIADYLDRTCSEIDTLIAKKEHYLIELENYKKSLIYEYVTGKKEVPNG